MKPLKCVLLSIILLLALSSCKENNSSISGATDAESVTVSGVTAVREPVQTGVSAPLYALSFRCIFVNGKTYTCPWECQHFWGVPDGFGLYGEVQEENIYSLPAAELHGVGVNAGSKVYVNAERTDEVYVQSNDDLYLKLVSDEDASEPPRMIFAGGKLYTFGKEEGIDILPDGYVYYGKISLNRSDGTIPKTDLQSLNIPSARKDIYINPENTSRIYINSVNDKYYGFVLFGDGSVPERYIFVDNKLYISGGEAGTADLPEGFTLHGTSLAAGGDSSDTAAGRIIYKSAADKSLIYIRESGLYYRYSPAK